MATERFPEILERLRRQEREQAEIDLIVAAFRAGEQLDKKALKDRMADWQPPPDEALERRAAQKVLSAAGYYQRTLDDRAAQVAAADDKRDRAQADLDAADQAKAKALELQEQAEADLADGRQAVEELPEHLKGIPPSGVETRAQAQPAVARAEGKDAS